MTLLDCDYCGSKFNGRVKLIEHKLTHSEYRKKASAFFDRQIKLMEQGKPSILNRRASKPNPTPEGPSEEETTV